MDFSPDEVQAIIREHVSKTFNIPLTSIGMPEFQIDTLIPEKPYLRQVRVYVDTGQTGVPQNMGPYRTPGKK
jgi:hypothetical protein